MVGAAHVVAGGSGIGASPPEWWERVAGRLAAWMAAHRVLVGRFRVVWTVAVLIWFVVIGVTGLVMPNVHAASAVYLGVAWLLLCWFWLARTRTLSLAGLTMLYAVCVPWSAVIGIISALLSKLVTAGWWESGPGTLGPTVGIAAFTEESLKLLPVAVLVALAPGRVRRFSTVDWLLVGFASGAGFLTVEEIQRRLGTLAQGGQGLLGSLMCGSGGLHEQMACYGIAGFSLNPFGAKSPGTGGVFDAGGPLYAGHHVLTGLVTAAIGVGVVVWRAAARRRSAAGGAGQRVLACLIPVTALWVAIADHVVANAGSQSGTVLPGASPDWLRPHSTIPMVFRAWYHIAGQGHGRVALLLVLLVLGLLCDGARARHRGYWAVAQIDGSPWPDRVVEGWIRRLPADRGTGLKTAGLAALLWLGSAAVSVAYMTARDLRQSLNAHARQPGENRRQAMLRGRLMLQMQRETRMIAADLDAGPASRCSYRALALLAAGVLLVLAFVAGPALAASIGWSPSVSIHWLAGLFDAVARWWGHLSPAQQFLLTALAGMALAIPFGFGAGFFLAGGITYLAEHGHGVAALIRDPRAATSNYIHHRSIGGMVLDGGEFVLTFLPAGIGAGAGTGIRQATQDYLHDPAAWRAAKRIYLTHPDSERGAVDLDELGRIFKVNGRRPINADKWAGKVFAGPTWTPELQAAYPNGVRFTDEGFPDLKPYAHETVELPEGFTGDRERDFRLANKEMAERKPGWSKPKGFTWHHVEDGKTLHLVPKRLHNAIKHTGGHAVVQPKK